MGKVNHQSFQHGQNQYKFEQKQTKVNWKGVQRTFKKRSIIRNHKIYLGAETEFWT